MASILDSTNESEQILFYDELEESGKLKKKSFPLSWPERPYIRNGPGGTKLSLLPLGWGGRRRVGT